MGVKYSAIRIPRIDSAMTNNLRQNEGHDRLSSGCDHLILLDSGELSEQPTQLVKVFTDIIIPVLRRLQEAVDDIHPSDPTNMRMYSGLSGYVVGPRPAV